MDDNSANELTYEIQNLIKTIKEQTESQQDSRAIEADLVATISTLRSVIEANSQEIQELRQSLEKSNGN